jgi:hypothetical protein
VTAEDLPLVTTTVQAGTFAQVELDFDNQCASNKSVQLTNAHGTFSSADSVTAVFKGPFTAVSGTYNVKLAIDAIVSQLASVTSSTQVSPIVQFVPGSATATSAGSSSPVSLPGLVGWWKFDGNVFDISGSGFNGTVHGSAGYIPGKFGQAIALSGTSNYLDVGNVGPASTAGMSVVFWVYFNSTPTQYSAPLSKTNGGGGGVGEYQWAISGNEGSTNLAIQTSDAHASTGMACSISLTGKTGQWLHYAFVWSVDGSTCQSYENGALATSESVTIHMDPSFNYPLMIGGPGYGGFFDGALDDVRVYNRALSASEIQAIKTTGM